MFRAVALTALGATLLALVAGCGGGGSAVDDAARASDDAARAGSAFSREGVSAGRVVSAEEFIRRGAQARAAEKARLILEAQLRKLRAKGVEGDVREEICTLVELARGASPGDLLLGKVAGKARRTRMSQLMAVRDELLAALEDRRALDAFLALACGL